MATAKENLEDFITCSVCLEKFEGRDPRLLPCGHAFCLTCIQDIYKTATAKTDNKLKDDEFRCPQCTTMSNIPGKSVINYPKFFHATHMQDILAEINKGSNPSHTEWGVCQNDQDEVAGYCFTCKMSYCDQCLQTHNTTSWYNNHVYVDVNMSNIKSLVCSPHNKPLQAYCTDCCKAMCAQCHLTDHRDHRISDFVINHQPIDPLPDLRKDSSKDKIQRIERMQREFNVHISCVHDMVSKQEEVMLSQIRDQSKSLHAKLVRHQADTNRDLDNMKKRLREFDDLVDQANIQITKIKDPIPKLTSISLHNMDTLISDILGQIPEEPPTVMCTSKCLFTPQTMYQMLGTLSRQAQQLAEIKMNRHIHDICWTETGDLLVTRLNKLVMYNKHGESVPYDVCDVEGFVLSVSTQQSVVAMVAGSYTCGRHCYITSLTNGQEIRRVCRLPDHSYFVKFTVGGDIVVGGNSFLLKYTTRGKRLWMRETRHKASYITTTPDNRIIVSGDKQLSVHDEDGRWLSSFPKDPATLPIPQGICADSSGNVFVADSDQKAVLMYTSDGTYVKEVVRMDKQPQNLALYQDRYLAVANVMHGYKKLDVYDISQCCDL